MAFRIVWQSKIDKQWHYRYYQSNWQNASGNAPGEGIKGFPMAMSLYAHLTHGQWPEPINNQHIKFWKTVEWWGHANLLRVKVDRLRQVIRAQVVNEPLLPLPQPNFDLGAVVEAMEDHGFENVNAKWQSLQFDWLTDPQWWPDGKAGKPHASVKKRTDCDFHLVMKAVNSNMKCERVPNQDRCTDCAKRGIVCSWTKVPKLFGVQGWQKAGDDRLATTETQRSIMLLCQLPAANEQKRHGTMADPHFAKIGKDEE
ncbi:uncharacterized protein LTR77_007545 [Saxophila tyrrhenica]|uniref:Zn(2)-C6 fungal-type domain-containing protein n=1 Tax=Saxophila tyrrhenica TaxID=1690608 RepID=A0AAV9P2U9_9PEZI|nr:hypothetical protein LTR77_007545 [Saxophila tyrrhenica]